MKTKKKKKKKIIKVKNSIHKKQIKHNTKKKVKRNTNKVKRKAKVKHNTKKKKPSIKKPARTKKKPTTTKKKLATKKKPATLNLQNVNVNKNNIAQEINNINKSLTNYLKNNDVKKGDKIFTANKTIIPKLVAKRRSYSPSINNKLLVRSLKTLPQMSIKLCDSLLHININNGCLAYNDKKVQFTLLHNLKASKHLDVTRFIPPVQFLSNCWFI